MPDEQQALDRHIALAVAALPVTPELELAAEPRTPCDDPSDLGPKGRIQMSRRYRLAGVPADTVFDALHAYWLTNGYRLLQDGRHRMVQDTGSDRLHPAPLLWVEHKHDGFRMTLVGDVRGGLSLIATSPCLWPEST
jgi:hypothetical protein